MKKKAVLSTLLMFFTFSINALYPDQKVAENITKRFALAVGANNGGLDRVRLRYAVSDAESIIKVFKEMGGVAAGDSLLLADPNQKIFFSEMERLKEKIQKSKSEYSRVEVIFYYSGHSDEEHILLGNEKVSYKDFRAAINSIEADVRIAILDSCASGAFTRMKGGKMRLPFLMDTAYDMKGYAVMTSSSSDETSQESDRIKGSFFTHYLVSGMRGAADMIQDGRVTLNEAYQFAFAETLAQTAKAMGGPQHPNYNIQMSGTGDVVMTDIRESSAVLAINENISGKIFIHNQENVLVVELTKPAGRKIELGLEEGKFRVINIREGDVYESEITLQRGKRFELNANELVKTDKIYTTPRGITSDQDLLKKRKTKNYRFKRHNVDLKLTYWHNAKSETAVSFISFKGVSIEADTGGLSGKIAYDYHYNDKYALSFSAGVLQVKSHIANTSIETSIIIPVSLGAKYYLAASSLESPTKPYLSGAAGIIIGTESSVEPRSVSTRIESAFMLHFGGGTDFFLGSLIKLSADIGFNLATDFSNSIGGRKNYSGLELSVGFGVMF